MDRTKTSTKKSGLTRAEGRTQRVRNCPVLVLVMAAGMLVFFGSKGTDAMSFEWGQRIEVASGKAYRGPWRMNESKWHFVDDSTVAMTEQNDVGVAWADHDRLDIFFQVYGPDNTPGFAEPVNISKNPETFSWLPRVIMTSENPSQIYVLWQEIIFSGGSHGGEIMFSRSTDGGKSFSKPINLSQTKAGAGKGRLSRDIWFNGSLDLARAQNGDLFAAWTVYEGRLDFSRSTDNGKTFTEPVLVAGGEGDLPARGPSLAVEGNDTVHLVWSVGEDRSADIRYSVSGDGGRSFQDPVQVTESKGHCDGPKIVVDDSGMKHLAYGESPEGPFEEYRIMYARSGQEKTSFDRSRSISGFQERDFESENFPYLELDGQGNPYVLWELFPDRKIRSRGLGFTFSRDGGKTFASPVIVPGTLDEELGFNGSQQGLYMNKLAVNSRGELAIVNCTFSPNQSSHIWLIRGRIGERP